MQDRTSRISALLSFMLFLIISPVAYPEEVRLYQVHELVFKGPSFTPKDAPARNVTESHLGAFILRTPSSRAVLFHFKKTLDLCANMEILD